MRLARTGCTAPSAFPMKCFGLLPPANPAAALPAAPAPSPTAAMVYGGLSFGAVSVAAYSIWAYRLVPGTAALYASIAAVYLGLGGVALARLVRPPRRWQRFPLLFATGFFVYAVCWCAFWFGLRGKYLADLWGAAAGLAAMTWLFQRAFGQRGGFALSFLALFAWHGAGYYAGGELYAAVRGSTGRLLWGAAHGVGFGAGLGCVLSFCQRSRNP